MSISRKDLIIGSEVKRHLSDLIENEKRVRISISKLPKGELMMTKSGDKYYAIHVYKSGKKRIRKGINKKPKLVYALAHKKYLEVLLARMVENRKRLELYLSEESSIDSSAILKKLPKYYDQLNLDEIINPTRGGLIIKPNPTYDPDVEPVFARLELDENMSPEEWAIRPYRQNDSYLESKKHRASGGLLVRSKNEVILTEIYNEIGIYFHYDEVIVTPFGVLSPDFVGIRPSDRKLIYHEHVGLQESEYRSHLDWKRKAYAECGIIEGKNLILTFDDEDEAIDAELAKDMITHAYFKRCSKDSTIKAEYY